MRWILVGVARVIPNRAAHPETPGLDLDVLKAILAFTDGCIYRSRGKGLSLWSRNVAVGSAAWHDLALTAVDRLFPYGGVALSTALVMNGGQSDLWDGESGAQVYAEEVAYAAAARAAGFDVVVAITICPGQYSEAEEAARLEHNDLLLADASGGFDAVVDVAALPELADPTDLTYYDALGIHWTEAGAQIAADALAPVLQANLGL